MVAGLVVELVVEGVLAAVLTVRLLAGLVVLVLLTEECFLVELLPLELSLDGKPLDKLLPLELGLDTKSLAELLLVLCDFISLHLLEAEDLLLVDDCLDVGDSEAPVFHRFITDL